MFHQACCNISSWIIFVTNKFRFGAIKYYIMLSYFIDIHSISCKMDEKFNLKWQSHQSHTKSLISELIVSQEFADVTLVCDDAKQLKAHKFMLSSSSTVFKSILKSDKEHPFIYLRGIKTNDMMAILQFIYNGRHNGCCPCTCTLCCSRIKVHKKQYSQMLQLHSSLKDCYKYTGCKQQQFFKCFGSYVIMNYELMTTRTKQITKSIARNIDMLTTF